MDEPDLIRRAAAGDRAAFHAIVERHRVLVYRVAYLYAGNHHDAEDIAQEVFVKLFTSIGSFRAEAQFTSWLYRVAMNCCIDHGRRRAATWAREEPDATLPEAPSAGPTPEGQAYAGELDRVLASAVDTLPPRQRLVFIMRHYQEMKLCEIASALELQEGTVKRQLHAAIRRLRGALQSVQIGVGVRR